MVWAWMLWLSYALGTRTLLWFGHGCSGYRMLLEHERYYGLGMDALVIVCSWNTNVIMVWAWMLWLSYALGTRTLLWFGHGCSGYRMLLEHEHYYGLGMDALVSVCSSFIGSCPQLSAVRPPLQPSWLASPAPWPTPRGRQLHGVCLHPVRRPTFGLHGKKAALRPRGLRPETHETGTCTKYCVH